MVTFTGDWSQSPVAAGSVGFTSTVIVGLPPPDGVVATVPTEEITPGVTSLLGRVMLTWSPTATSDCSSASKAMETWRVVEVADSTGWPAVADAPRVADTEVTRTAVGSNTTWPKLRVPFWVTPSAGC